MPVRVSVVTPSFNQARYLEETLRSIISQRDEIHEYFVLDGGSADGSADIIRRYSSWIDYWVSEKDKGQSDAIQKGFARASGDVLVWVNSDDVLLPGAVRKVREAFERNPHWDVLTGYHARIDVDGRILALFRIPGESRTAARWGVTHICQPASFFRRSLYEKVGGINPDLHCVMDSELFFRMFEANATWGHLPEFLAGFRLHELSKGESWKKKYAEEYAWLRQRYPAYQAQGLQHKTGLTLYRLSQLLSPSRMRSILESLRYRGRKLSERFGEWSVAA